MRKDTRGCDTCCGNVEGKSKRPKKKWIDGIQSDEKNNSVFDDTSRFRCRFLVYSFCKTRCPANAATPRGIPTGINNNELNQTVVLVSIHVHDGKLLNRPRPSRLRVRTGWWLASGVSVWNDARIST